MKLVPEGQEMPIKGNPLVISKTNRAIMVDKAKEFLTEPKDFKVLMDELEQFYVAQNKHYTSEQLRDIVAQVEADLRPISEEPII